jgi:hypothetical protein
MPTAMEGDVDGDLQPDLVFLSRDRRADVILNISGGLVALRTSSSLFRVGISRAPGDQISSVVTVRKGASSYVWGFLDIVTGSEKSFATIPSKGQPVLGCYFGNELVPSSLVRLNATSEFRAFPGDSSKISVKVPRTASKARCGQALSGDSPIFYVAQNKNRKRVSVSGVTRSGRAVMNSPQVPPRFKLTNLALAVRGPGLAPFVAILGRRARTQEIYSLSVGRRWKNVVVPIDKTLRIRNIGVTSHAGYSHIVVQLLNRRTGELSYYSAPLK